MMISPFALEGEKMFACDREQVRVGKTWGSPSTSMVPDHHQDYDNDENYGDDDNDDDDDDDGPYQVDTCEIVGGRYQSLGGSSPRTLMPVARN